MKQKYFLNRDTILIDRGDHCVRFNRGDELKNVPDGSLASMLRLGWAVTKDRLEDVLEPAAVESSEEVEDPPKEFLTPAWKETPIADLGLPPNIVKTLNRAHLETVADILDYGASHKSLASIKGIGETSEVEIQNSILALRSKQDASSSQA